METIEQSIEVPDLIFSHQYWASEAALVVWRRNKEHRYSQTQGIKKISASHRIRLGPRIWPRIGEGQSKELPFEQTSRQKCILALQKSGDIAVELDDSSVRLTGRYVSLTCEDKNLITFVFDSSTKGLLSKIL